MFVYKNILRRKHNQAMFELNLAMCRIKLGNAKIWLKISPSADDPIVSPLDGRLLHEPGNKPRNH